MAPPLVPSLGQLRSLFTLLHQLHVRPVHFITAFILSAIAAALEGASLTLLLPLVQGVSTFDFSFIGNFAAWQFLSERYVPLQSWSQRDFFLLLLLLVFCTAIGKNVFRYFSSVSVAHIARIASHNMRRQLFGTYLGVNKLFFDRHNVGYLNQVLVDFTERVTRPLAEGHQLLNAALAFAVYLAVMFSISWKITLCVVAIFPVMVVMQRLLITRIKQRSHHLAASITRFSKSTFNTLTSIPLVMANMTQEPELSRFTQVSAEVAETEFKMTKLQHLIRPVQETITLLTVLILVISMAILVQRGQVGASSSFLVYFYVLLNAATSFAALQRMQGLIAQAEGPTHVIQDVITQGKLYPMRDGAEKYSGFRRAIVFRNLTFSYPDGRSVLRGLTFTIPRGQMTALVGPSGAGKSTIINLLMRLYESPPHTLLIDDTDIARFSLHSLRAHIALVSQDTILFNDTLRANLVYGLPPVSPGALDEALRKAHLEEFIRSLPDKLETPIGDRGVKLSGGEKQRVAIARALLKGAEIILLDEATSALDSHTEKLIQAAIDAATADKTAVVVAHRLSTIQHADNIVVIDDGRVIEQGRLKELLDQRGAFYRYWEEQKFF